MERHGTKMSRGDEIRGGGGGLAIPVYSVGSKEHVAVSLSLRIAKEFFYVLVLRTHCKPNSLQGSKQVTHSYCWQSHRRAAVRGTARFLRQGERIAVEILRVEIEEAKRRREHVCGTSVKRFPAMMIN
jgi:hypothetical protein